MSAESLIALFLSNVFIFKTLEELPGIPMTFVEGGKPTIYFLGNLLTVSRISSAGYDRTSVNSYFVGIHISV